MPQMFFGNWRLLAVLLVLILPATLGRAQQSATNPAPAAPSAPAPPVPGSDADEYVKFGEENGARGDLEGAIAAFDQAIKIDPKFAPAYYFRGYAYSLQKKPEEAIADYSRAIQLEPKYKKAYYQRGNMEGQKGDFDKAISDFSEVITLDPKYAPAHYNLGHVKYFKGDLEGALDELNQALSLDPNSALSYYIRGLVENAQGRRPEATSDFQKSLGLGFPFAAFWVWISETESSQHGLARQDLSVALTKPGTFKPDDWPSQIGSFMLDKISQDDLIAKARASDDPLEVNDRLCEAWFYAGILKRLSGDSKGAQASFAQAIASGSTSSEEYVEANREMAELQSPAP